MTLHCAFIGFGKSATRYHLPYVLERKADWHVAHIYRRSPKADEQAPQYAHIHFTSELDGVAPIFPYTFYHLTHYWFAAADIPVANDTPVHYADAIRCNVRRPPQGSLPLLTRRVSA